MCGIIWVKSLKNKPVRDVVIERYKNQRLRGTKGFGFIEVKDEGCTVYKNTTEDMMLANLSQSNATEILFHHRWPTSTDNVISACHPFLSVSDDGRAFYLVHNGVLHNDDALKKKHEALGIEYQSTQSNGDFNDSECLAHEFMLWKTGRIDTFDAKGSIAIMVEETDLKGKPIKFYFARNDGSPLVVKKTKKTLQMASEGSGVSVPIDKLYTYDYSTNEFLDDIDFVMAEWTNVYANAYTNAYSGEKKTVGKCTDWAYNSQFDRYDGYDDFGNLVDVFYNGLPPAIEDELMEDYCLNTISDITIDEVDAELSVNSGVSSDSQRLLQPPLLDIAVGEAIMRSRDVNFEAGIRDGLDGTFGVSDYYNLICPEIENLQSKLDEYQELILLARNEKEVKDIEDSIDEAYEEQMYFMGVSYQMYKMS